MFLLIEFSGQYLIDLFKNSQRIYVIPSHLLKTVRNISRVVGT